jgi:hypothetical protein
MFFIVVLLGLAVKMFLAALRGDNPVSGIS